MNKKFTVLVLLAALTVSAAFTSCEDDKSFTVEFVSNGGNGVQSQTLKEGSTIYQPAKPERKGYVFSGWYSDSNFTTPWDFITGKITSDMRLYAKWVENIQENR